MKLVIEIEFGNSAMQRYSQARSIIRDGLGMSDHRAKPSIGDSGTFRDVNGNGVGMWEVVSTDADLSPAALHTINREKLADAVHLKFGSILAQRPHPNGGTVFLILRAEPANAALPYMTIRGVINASGKADFSWGHYDMIEEVARKDFDVR
jgi:hypothetical protein